MIINIATKTAIRRMLSALPMLIVLLCGCRTRAQTTGAPLFLAEPIQGSPGWGDKINSNSVIINNAFTTMIPALPTTNGIVYRTSALATRTATSADIIALWTSCTSGYLSFNGTCSSPGASGFPITIGSTSIGSGSTTTAITGLTVNGITPTTFGFLDPTSSVQTQLNSKQATLTLTTTGTTGASTFIGNVLNVPNYTPGTGTVTSVGLTTPAWLTVGGSPVTSAGTLAITATSGQTANSFLATPNGTTGAVGLRTIVAADVPTLNQNTSGTAANLSGTPTLPNGITATTQTIGDNSTKLATDAFVLANTGTGTVTAVSVVSANGISGSSSGGTTPALTLALGAITPTSMTVTGSGIPISTATASNSDLAGLITLSGGTGTYSLTATYLTAPIVVCSDTTALQAVKCSATTTTITATGTSSDVIAYIVIGRT